MKTLTFTLLFALIGSVGFAQRRHEIDSLRRELDIAKQDTNRVLLMTELAINYQNSNPDSALMYGQQALDLEENDN